MSGIPLPTGGEAQFRILVEAARRGNWTAVDVASLAAHLAASGDQMQWEGSRQIADVASTGGPASLSTLLPPLWLLIHDCHVVKLAIPGRPAGAIDSLGTIPGYRVQLSTDEVRSVVRTCGFAHFLADQRFAPLDAALYQYRRRNGAVAIPQLAAASLLAKKLAVGVRLVGLDVRLGPHANFGGSRNEARVNAGLFCAAARQLGIEACAFLGEAKTPAQPWIGRGESLVALAYALGLRRGDAKDPWLDAHVTDCWRMATRVVTDATGTNSVDGPSPAETSGVRTAFEAHLVAQGATMADFLERVDEVLSARRVTLHAEAAGTLQVDLGVVRDAIVEAQGDAGQGRFRDPAGVRLLIKPGQTVATGEAIAAVRYSPSMDGQKLVAHLKSAFLVDRPAEGAMSPREENAIEVIHA